MSEYADMFILILITFVLSIPFLLMYILWEDKK